MIQQYLRTELIISEIHAILGLLNLHIKLMPSCAMCVYKYTLAYAVDMHIFIYELRRVVSFEVKSGGGTQVLSSMVLTQNLPLGYR